VNVLQSKENLGNSYQQYKTAANIIKTLGILIASVAHSGGADAPRPKRRTSWQG
jgi:hypothetical protein